MMAAGGGSVARTLLPSEHQVLGPNSYNPITPTAVFDRLRANEIDHYRWENNLIF